MGAQSRAHEKSRARQHTMQQGEGEVEMQVSCCFPLAAHIPQQNKSTITQVMHRHVPPAQLSWPVPGCVCVGLVTETSA